MIDRIYQIFNSLTKTEKRAFWCFCVTGITSGVILALLVFQSATIEVPEPSSGYREGIVGQPIAINPLLSGTNDADRDLAELPARAGGPDERVHGESFYKGYALLEESVLGFVEKKGAAAG